jgi:outer membrane protein TolC
MFVRGWTAGVAAVLLVGCAPSQAYLFDPVADTTEERIRIRPAWRPGWQRSAAAERRVREILRRPLRADDAALVAVLNSPALQARYAELGVAGGALGQARTLPNPELEAEVTWPVDGGEAQIELSAIQSVSALVALPPRVRVADARVRAARQRVVAATVALAARARIGFYEVVAAEQMRALRRLVLEAAGASAAFARGLHEAGNITSLALQRELSFEEEARLALLEADAAVAVAREALNTLLGLHGAELDWRTASELPTPPPRLDRLEHLERQAVVAALELQALRGDMEAAGQAVGLARLESVLPEVGVGVAASREGAWSVGPAVSVRLPVFDWGQGRRARAWSELRRLQHRYAAAAIAARASARAVRARLQAAHERVTRTRTRLLPLREKLLDDAMRQYNAMNLDAFELLAIRREQVAVEQSHVAALRDFWVAQVRADQLRAGSLPGSGSPDGAGSDWDEDREASGPASRED